MRKFLIPISVVVLALLGLGVSSAKGNPKDNFDPSTYEPKFKFKTYVVNGMQDTKEKLPLVITFHSQGGNLTVGKVWADRFAKYTPRFRILSIQGNVEGPQWWELGPSDSRESSEKLSAATVEWLSLADDLQRFIRWYLANTPTIGKPVLLGTSQGAQVALLLGSVYPDLFKEVVAISGYLLPTIWPKVKMTPTVMLHGTGDEVVPFKLSQDFAIEMINRDLDLHFVQFPTEGHSTTEEMRQYAINEVISVLD